MPGEVYIFGIKVISRLSENKEKMANKIFNVLNHLNDCTEFESADKKISDSTDFTSKNKAS